MAVINNSGQNFTLYYNVLEYFKTIMSNHPSLGSVTQGDIFEIDSREFPVYPLGNILITNASFGKKTSTFTCQLTIADKVKLKNNESSGSTNFQVIPFNGTDDVVDIHANTLAILNDLTAYTQRSVEAIEIDDDIECIPFKDNFDNGLAGWVCTFDMLVHNNKDMCLFPLLEQPVYPPSPTTTTTTSGPTTTTTTIAPTTTTTSTTTTTTLAPITFQSSGSCNGFEGNGVINVYNVLGGGSFPKFVGLNDGIFYPLTTPTQSFTGLGDGTFEVTVKNNEGYEASQSVVIDCAPVPTTTTTTSTTSTTTTTFAPISINVSGSCLPSGGAQLTILGITGGSGAPYFHSLQQDGVYLPSSSEYNTYTNLQNTIYTVYADNNLGSSGSQSVDLSGCQPLPTTTTTTTAGPTTTTTTGAPTTTTTAAPTTTTTSTTTTSTTTTTTTTAGPAFASFDYLIVAGGGGGARNGGGGAGAGGLISGSTTATLVSGSITQFAVVIGGGGAGSSATQGGNGSPSSFYSTSSIGGGGGGAGLGSYESGRNGGSGGGSHRTALPGTGSLGQGFNGNSGSGTGGSNGGGGGGASQTGRDFTDALGGIGGSGSVWLNGITYAGGGGGGSSRADTTSGGIGGGGFGGSGTVLSQLGGSGSVNTGGGAGGNGVNANINAPNGGSGVVIVRYPNGSVSAAGGLITSQSGYTYHTFNSSSNFVIYT
jgi:hypothetical protein